jgi:hypothetical protein
MKAVKALEAARLATAEKSDDVRHPRAAEGNTPQAPPALGGDFDVIRRSSSSLVVTQSIAHLHTNGEQPLPGKAKASFTCSSPCLYLI